MSEYIKDIIAAQQKPSDPVDHPAHYSRWKMEAIEFIAVNDLPWWMANVFKYCIRYDAKDGLKDLYKARSYLEMKIRQLEGHPRFWEKPVAAERQLNKAVAPQQPFVRTLTADQVQALVGAKPVKPDCGMCGRDLTYLTFDCTMCGHKANA